jgi:hypothetical protein
MEISPISASAAAAAQIDSDVSRKAAESNPLDRAGSTQKDVAAEVSMYALKQMLEMAGQVVDLLL